MSLSGDKENQFHPFEAAVRPPTGEAFDPLDLHLALNLQFEKLAPDLRLQHGQPYLQLPLHVDGLGFEKESHLDREKLGRRVIYTVIIHPVKRDFGAFPG